MADKKLQTEDDPFVLFRDWYDQASNAEINDPNAICVATLNPDGSLSARMVLLKSWDARGFVFYTNFESRKGEALLRNPVAAICIHWKSLRKQIRIEGTVEIVTKEEADTYFQSRKRGSQIGAWASLQSQKLDSRETLEKRVAELEKHYDGQDIPRPAHWSGFRVIPKRIEFWNEGEFRLHDRFVFEKNGTDGWHKNRLYP